MTYEDLVEKIKKAGGRVTGQRKIILQQLIKHQNKLQSVDELLYACQQYNSAINLTTIYRNLEFLDGLQLIYKTNIDRATSGYKLINLETHHHYMICSSCGKLLPIEHCPMSDDLIKAAEKEGFTISGHSMEVYGTCQSCS
ncbi:Fur family transcriptional regulator, zinc uptake regulator/Fur family transcriptional regulator, ferric uptake regulator [Halolactibacillus halophilus]|uniref:Fur family transcriptional regulator, zinc uptake regulator/Fur family transcriptional regulator, ferric uptake regulator n=1 Tax=Halolactibacillus halophilus TaxID=306540 RepID=A0A1I5NP94_9BACI|nr:Fur family transcriptional regulator [Halolactibacillus halophilus]GEM01409.1 zinc-specific metallo-regulatory protein [Halolactibacillus halophilus]SFP23552.1 Fur family transcriptional regulator, zinc uptake regulator/Fur family transcriptional regulator, ferric uptake regulator [Halolactibacillus halophilus]